MNHPVVIRPIQPEDWAAWKFLWDGYHAFYGCSGPSALPAEITQTIWARFFDAREPVHALVAESHDTCSGWRTSSSTAAPSSSPRVATCKTCSRSRPRVARESAVR